MMEPTWIKWILAVALVVTAYRVKGFTWQIGVCYGLNGDNLPAPVDVISLYKQYGIEMIRIYEPNQQVLQALRGSNLQVSVGVRNEDIVRIAGSQDAANAWVATNIVPYKNVDFRYISLGNEVIPGPQASSVTQAMQNIHSAVVSAGLSMNVTTVVAVSALGESYPPSQGAFSKETVGIMKSVVGFLSSIGSPLMINIYPYFAYVADPATIPWGYVIFDPKQPPVRDGDLLYHNLYDAMIDAFYAAMEKVGGANVRIAVSETGFPSAGNGNVTTPEHARLYNAGVFYHATNRSTPRRVGVAYDAFIFAMFNEDLKAPGVEQNFGLFYPNKKPVYPLF